jgi:hypothetical protein
MFDFTKCPFSDCIAKNTYALHLEPILDSRREKTMPYDYLCINRVPIFSSKILAEKPKNGRVKSKSSIGCG